MWETIDFPIWDLNHAQTLQNEKMCPDFPIEALLSNFKATLAYKLEGLAATFFGFHFKGIHCHVHYFFSFP